jgi:hypothetical protein
LQSYEKRKSAGSLAGSRSDGARGRKMAEYGSMLRHRWFLVVSLALLSAMLPLFILGKPVSGAGTLPVGFAQSSFAEGLTNPTAMAFAPDGSLFVAEQWGTLQVADTDGQFQEKTFLDIGG